MMKSSETEQFSVKQQAVLESLSKTADNDVKGIAVNQLKQLKEYYSLALNQAARSFRIALIASGVGLAFFMVIISYMVIKESASVEISTAGIIGGALSSFIAAVNFFLYGKTLEQLNTFQGKLENTQRFLLANSLCENLENALKQKTRARLIGKLVGVDDTDYLREHKTFPVGSHSTENNRHEFNPNLDSSGAPLPTEEIADNASVPSETINTSTVAARAQ